MLKNRYALPEYRSKLVKFSEDLNQCKHILTNSCGTQKPNVYWYFFEQRGIFGESNHNLSHVLCGGARFLTQFKCLNLVSEFSHKNIFTYLVFSTEIYSLTLSKFSRRFIFTFSPFVFIFIFVFSESYAVLHFPILCQNNSLRKLKHYRIISYLFLYHHE